MKTIFNNDRVSLIKKHTLKNIHYLVLWILAVISFSCNNKLEVEFGPAKIPFLDVVPTEINFTANETTAKQVSINTNVDNWNYTPDAASSWLTIEKPGNMLSIKPKEANTATSERTANITITADGIDPVTVKVKQAGKDRIIYNMAKGKYFGDLSKNGNAQFHFYMYHSDAPLISIRIEAFCKLPKSFEEFKLDAGNYTCATSGAATTFLPGSIEGLVLSPSIYYDESISKLILIKGGTFNVSLSGDDTYTITTDLSGTDYPSGDAAEVPRTTFTGKIEWERYSLKVEPSSINFAANEVGYQTATVITESPTWDFVPVAASWLTVTKQGNNMLRFTTNSANTSGTKRETTVTVRANSAIPVEVKVTQNGDAPACITYNTADCDYWGNIYKSATANFDLWMYNSSNKEIGLKIEGFCALPSSFPNFRLEEGTYNIASTSAVKTFLPGKLDGLNVSQTYLYNRDTHSYTLITGGTFTVSLSGSTYIITTSFTGKNVDTDAIVNDICITFTGQVKYVDKTELKIPKSTYAATGTPSWLTNKGPSSWNGNFNPNDAEKYWEITNYANNANIKVKAHYRNEQLILDAKDKVWENATDEAFLEFLVKYEGGLYSITRTDWPLKYNESTRTIDFSGTINVDFGGSIGTVNNLALHVGVFVYNKTTGAELGWLTDVYPDIKLVLTPISSSPAVQLSNSLVESRKTMDMFPSKTVNGRNTNVATNVKKMVETGKNIIYK